MVALGIVLGLVFFQGSEEERRQDEEGAATLPDDVEAQESPDEPADDPSQPAPDYAAQAPTEAPAPAAGGEPAVAAGTEAGPDAAPFPPEVREHAKDMVIPSLAEAMERRDLKHLRELLQLLNEHRGEGIVTETDLGAVEAAIACLEREPEAQQDAADFLRFGTRSALSESLAKACGLR